MEGGRRERQTDREKEGGRGSGREGRAERVGGRKKGETDRQRERGRERVREGGKESFGEGEREGRERFATSES